MEEKLSFKYFAMAIFRDATAFEIRVISLNASNMETAVESAIKLMKLYAVDFNCEYLGKVCVYEAGIDMMEEYGEVYSLTCERDEDFELAFVNKLVMPIGIRSASS